MHSILNATQKNWFVNATNSQTQTAATHNAIILLLLRNFCINMSTNKSVCRYSKYLQQCTFVCVCVCVWQPIFNSTRHCVYTVAYCVPSLWTTIDCNWWIWTWLATLWSADFQPPPPQAQLNGRTFFVRLRKVVAANWLLYKLAIRLRVYCDVCVFVCMYVGGLEKPQNRGSIE